MFIVWPLTALGGVFLAVLLAVALLSWRQPRPDNTPVATLVAARKHENRTSVLAVLTAVAVGVVGNALAGAALSIWGRRTAPGLAVALAPFLVASAFLAVHAVGERTWPQPVGAVRIAWLARRGVRELAPRRVSALGMTALVGLIGVIAFGLTAAPDGRSVPLRLTPEMVSQGVSGGASGPYPGWPYGLPVLVALGVVLLGTGGVLAMIARRPAVAGTRVEDDEALRRTSARRVLGGVQFLIGLTLSAMLLIAAGALGNSGYVGLAWSITGGALLLSIGSMGAGGTSFFPVPPAAVTSPGAVEPTDGVGCPDAAVQTDGTS